MALVYFITHPEVIIDVEVPVPEWPLSEKGIQRMQQLVAKDWVLRLTSIYCSSEQKAIDGATILAEHLHLPYLTCASLGENDRSSTGYFPQTVFETMANRFFEHPQESVEGWERAADAQARIVDALNGIIEAEVSSGDIAIVSHGAVGTLLLCHLTDSPISRSLDQPGGGGGNVFCFEKKSRKLIHGWKSIENT